MSGGVLRNRALTGLAVTALTSSVLMGCTSSSQTQEASSSTGANGGSGSNAEDASDVAKPVVKINVDKGAQGVPVDRVVEVSAADGQLTSVAVTTEGGKLPGTLNSDGVSWRADTRLEPGMTYRVKAVAEGADGSKVKQKSSFTTQALSLDEQTYPSVAPLDGETVGVGMPVIVNFDLPVTDRASFEKQMSVTSTPAQKGAWYWISDNEAHYRPKNYWKAGTKVDVDVDINGVSAGNGIYGQEDRDIEFEVGDANIYKVDIATHEMKVTSNGKLLRTLPVTNGKSGFTTRSGIKVIMEKFDSKRMNSETVGIASGSAESYDIDNVQWAMRTTNSGEFIHAAPWSVGSQGYANVSHGCTGLSTSNAAFLYSMSKRGDVVEYVGSDRGIEPGNGYSDWNVSWADYKQGSAL